MMAKRDRRLITILGKKRQGKTYFAKQFFKAHKAPQKAKIVCDKSGNWPEGEFPPGAFSNKKLLKQWLEVITNNWRGPPGPRIGMEGGLLVLDDADAYVETHVNSFWGDLWNRNAHFRLDVIVTAHRPQGVPKDCLANSDQIILFAMKEKHALDYLSEIDGLEAFGQRNEKGERLLRLPTERGKALVFNTADDSISHLDLKLPPE